MLLVIHLVCLSILGVVAFLAVKMPPFWLLFALLVPVYIQALMDTFQKRHAVRRNFPIIGNLRYFFELIRPELQQYFVESNHDGRPIPREFRSVVYQRAKGALDTLPFGTQRDVNSENHEWVHHSMVTHKIENRDMRTTIGGPQCSKPYSASIFNISAMSYGSLSKNAVKALNLGARDGHFYHNTGEGAISSFHLSGGDLVWQIGTGYFGCRDLDGNFSEDKFKEKAQLDNVKMIEVKISQGAKPGKGGILPGAKVTPEIAEIRGVEVGKSVISPSSHSTFSNPIEMLQWMNRLRELSGGKPVGFKLCVGRRSEFFSICKAIVETGIYPDFINVDGSEGGTGAAPLEFANSVGRPLDEGLAFVVDTLIGFDLRDKIKVICAGKILTSFHMLSKIAIGADVINSARGMMLALGCIQALKCNSNHCPVGVATTNPQLVRGLYVPDKAQRVHRYHDQTVSALADIIGSMGYTSTTQLKRSDVFRRLMDGRVANFEQIWPSMEKGALLNLETLPDMPDDLKAAFESSRSKGFWGAV